MFFSVITKNLLFKRWHGVKDEKFQWYWGSLKHLIFMWGGGDGTKGGELGQFADLRREGLAEEEGGGVFEECLTDLFINNFLFWWSTVFLYLNIPTEIPLKSFMQCQQFPNLPPSLETSPGGTWTQSLVTNFLKNTTSKIYWSPQARFPITCSNFKL